MGYDEGTRVSSGVKRISPTTVRVMVGDADFVRQALKLGVGYKDVSLALGNTKDLSDGKLHAVDIDISNQAGWDAYQAFLSSGKLPEERHAGHDQPDAGRDARLHRRDDSSRPSSAGSSSAARSTAPTAA